MEGLHYFLSTEEFLCSSFNANDATIFRTTGGTVPLYFVWFVGLHYHLLHNWWGSYVVPSLEQPAKRCAIHSHGYSTYRRTPIRVSMFVYRHKIQPMVPRANSHYQEISLAVKFYPDAYGAYPRSYPQSDSQLCKMASSPRMRATCSFSRVRMVLFYRHRDRALYFPHE